MAAFNTPDPPELPPVNFADGTRMPESDLWKRTAKLYTTNLDPTTNKFRINLRGLKDHSQDPRYHLLPPHMRITPNPYPQLKLGPPSQRPDWHPLLEKYGLQVMEAAGFVNSDVHMNELQMPHGRLANWMHPDHPIHPVFRPDMWDDLGPTDYQLMLPALQLASAILDEPDTLRFFAGLMVPSEQMAWVHVQHLGRTPIFQATDVLDTNDLVDVYQKIVNMRKFVRFRVSPWMKMFELYAAYGVTTYCNDDAGLPIEGARPGTHSSTCQISDAYLAGLALYSDTDTTHPEATSYLQSRQSLSSIPANQRIAIDPTNAVLRTTLLFTDTLLHEFGHAVNAAYFAPSTLNNITPSLNKQPNKICEPFYRGDRCNEIGHAFSDWIFKGNPQGLSHISPPLSMIESVFVRHIAPFGIYFQDRWDRWLRDGGQGHTRAISGVDYTKPVLMFPLPQAFVNGLFSKAVWERDVQRFGLGALRCPRLERWKIGFVPLPGRKGIYGTGEERWDMASS